MLELGLFLGGFSILDEPRRKKNRTRWAGLPGALGLCVQKGCSGGTRLWACTPGGLLLKQQWGFQESCVLLYPPPLLEFLLLWFIKKSFFKKNFQTYMKFGQWNSMLWAKGERKYHPRYFLLASVVEVWCMSLSRVWHNVSFLEVVGILDTSLGILNPGAVNIWAVAFSYLFI